MPKKKVKALFPEQEHDAQRIFDAMSPKQLEEMAEIDKVLSLIPKKMQDAILTIVEQLEEMPVGNRKKLFDAFAKMTSIMSEIEEDTDMEEESEEGFCICYSNNGSFCAQYLINNMYFSIGFRLENVGNNGYTEYLEICNLLGLPTSNEITEAVSLRL